MENLASLYATLSYVAFGLAGAFLILAIVIFFRANILKVIGDLTGRNAKRSIEQLRLENERSGRKSFRPTPAAVERGKTTEPLPKEEVKKEEEKQKPAVDEFATEVLADNDDVGGTEILDDNDEIAGTEVLADNDSFGGTEVLTETDELGTTPLDIGTEFIFLKNVIEIHTEERI